MFSQLSPDVPLPLIAAISLCLAALYVVIVRRHTSTWKAGVVTLLACAELMMARSLIEASPDGATLLFWYKMQFIGFAVAPTGFLCLALRYSGQGYVLSRRTYLLFSIFPALTVGLTFSNELHGWMWNPANNAIIVSSAGSLPTSAWGAWNWLFVAYAYCILSLGVFSLVRTLIRSRQIYGWQASGIVIATIVAWLASALDTFDLSPLPPFFASALGFTIGIVTATFALSRLHRRDLLSVTRGTMLNSISDCIVVVDEGNRIVDINLATERLVAHPVSQVIGNPLEQFLPELKSQEDFMVVGSHEVTLCRENQSLIFDLRVSQINDSHGRLVSRVIALRDITGRKRAEKRLAMLNDCLLSFGVDQNENINRLVAFCGEQFGATCALYNRLEDGMLRSLGQWHTPPDYTPVDKPDGHICYDVIRSHGDDVHVIRDLMQTVYAQTDPNVVRYGLRTYIGKAVWFDGTPIGSLCLVYQNDQIPRQDDLNLLGIVASAVGVEEKRKHVEKTLQQTKENLESTVRQLEDSSQRLQVELAERKQTESALRESEAQFRNIVAGTQAWLVGVDTRGRFTYMNNALANAMGCTVEEMIGRLYLRFVHPADRDLVSRFYLDQIKNGEKSNTLEYRLVTKQGETRWVRFISNLNMGDGKVVGQTGVALDITENKRAEELLRLQGEIAVNLSEGVCLTRVADGVIVYCNARFEEMFGYDSGELVGENVSVLNASDFHDPIQIAQAIAEGVQKNNRWQGEIYNIRKDGTRFWSHASLSQFQHAEYGAVQVAVQQDITKRKQAEKALQESHDRLLTILDSIDADIYVADLKTYEILFLNRHMRKSFGDNLVGLICWQVFRGGSVPCPDCTNPKLVDTDGNPAGMCIWEGQNVITRRWYTNYDRAIQWIDGRFVRLEIATDITERKRAEEETALKNRQLTMLNQLGQSLNKLGTPAEILERTSDLIGHVLDNRNLYIALYDPATNYVSFPIYWMNGEKKYSIEGRPLGRGLTECVIRSRAPVLIPDHVREALAERGVELIGRECCCYLGVPILIDGQAIGVIAVQDYERANMYDASHIELISTIASQAAIALENARLYAAVQQELNERKRAEEQLNHNAFHDALTNLPNRALFMDRLGRAIERTKRHKEKLFAVLFLDLDRFKVINDSLGHAIGDQLLIESAKRLVQCIRDEDTVARLGGDEFVILLNEITDNKNAIMIADRICQTLAQQFELGSHRIVISASIGVVQSAARYESAEDMLRDADVAMYRAKALGRGRYEMFDTEMRDRAMTRLELETDLRQAIERQEFSVYYQPIISLETNRIVGFEALVRWRHPNRGVVSPAEFIPMAEETGLIVPIGHWVLREACRQMREWQLQFPQEQQLTISVNLSAKQFSQADLLTLITTALHETGLDAHSLKLELTESLIVEDSQVVTGKLEQLRESGVQVQIDDFGTGYSSLGYLHRLPIDTLKIDRTFISKMGMNGNGSEIVRTILALAHELGMQVIAEGVETVEQLSKLKEMECEYGQGYYFTKPMDSQAAGMLIANPCYAQ